VPVVNRRDFNFFSDQTQSNEVTKSVLINQEPFDYNTWRSSHRTERKYDKLPSFRPPTYKKRNTQLNDSQIM
jgi:hypothetical protein